jgi:hypothetical protein
VFGQREIAQAVIAKIAQVRVRRKIALEQCRGRTGEQNLTAVADRQQPRNAIDRRSEVIAVALAGGSGMDCRAHRQAAQFGEILGREQPLHVEHRRNGVLRPGERGAECIAQRLENVAAPVRDRLTHQLVVTAHGRFHRREIALPAPRARFDVGKGERHRSADDWFYVTRQRSKTLRTGPTRSFISGAGGPTRQPTKYAS